MAESAGRGDAEGATPPAAQGKGSATETTANPDRTETSTGSADGGSGSSTDFEAERKRLNEENKKHRLRAKQLEEENTSIKSALAKALGVETDESAKAAQDAAAAQEAKDKRLFLRGEFLAMAAKEGAHDAADLWRLADSELRDIAVDLKNETIDRDALKAKVGELKKSRSWAFAQPAQGKGNAAAAPPADGNGRPTNAENANPYKRWRELVGQHGKDSDVTQKFWKENQKAIFAHWPKT
jgi:hypothetical protein